jgi:hypothetical protein
MDDEEVKAGREERRVRRETAGCNNCGQKGTVLKCAGYHSDSQARYCNKKCQKSAWKGGHKKVCPKKEKEIEVQKFGSDSRRISLLASRRKINTNKCDTAGTIESGPVATIKWGSLHIRDEHWEIIDVTIKI